MNCNGLSKLLLCSIIFTVIGDLLAFFAELLNQKCDKKEKRDQQRKEETLSQELDSLRKRIVVLESKTIS